MLIACFRLELGIVNLNTFVVVPDKRIRNVPEVILVRRWVSWGSGNLEGEGWVRGGTGEGQFTSNLRPRWTIPVTARRVPSK